MVDAQAYVGGGWVPVRDVIPKAELPDMPTPTNSLGELYFQFTTLNMGLDAAQIAQHRIEAAIIGRYEDIIRAHYQKYRTLANLKVERIPSVLSSADTSALERVLSSSWDDLFIAMTL